MQILFINGSPKGDTSITIQTALYLERRFPEYSYEILNAGQQIHQLEKDFSKAADALKRADLIIFCYPVYTFLAPSQLHRFLELLKKSGIDLAGRAAAQISTSKHFFDVTAQRFIEENCQDLGMHYLGGLSADMEDLQSAQGRHEADCFFEQIRFDLAHGFFQQALPQEASHPRPVYQAQLEETEKRSGRQIAVVTNAAAEDANLNHMIEDFVRCSAYPVRVVNVRTFPFAGGCLGCLHCAATGKCIYHDGFEEMLRTQVQTADAIVTAFTIENHFTHSSMKCYDDRQFCNGHRTVTAGKVSGAIIAGDYSREANLRMVMEARADVSGMYSCGIAGDEGSTAAEIRRLAESVCFALDHDLQRPQSFYGVGGGKIFRDLVYLMQGIMPADHAFYKSHGLYDFPQQRKGMLAGMKVLGLALRSPSV